MEHFNNLKSLVLNSIPESQQQIPESVDSASALLEWLTEKIAQLIATDFEGLLFLLYRIDVSEQKVKAMLAASKGEDAARTIAMLIIERQQQKLAYRERLRNYPTPTDDPERW